MAQEDQGESVIRMVEEQVALDARMEAEAREIAHGLIHGYLGPDDKVLDMPTFYSALVHAIKAAREQGQVDSSGQLGRL